MIAWDFNRFKTKPLQKLFSDYFNIAIGDLKYINCISRKIRLFVVRVVPNIDNDKLKCLADILSYYVVVILIC